MAGDSAWRAGFVVCVSCARASTAAGRVALYWSALTRCVALRCTEPLSIQRLRGRLAPRVCLNATRASSTHKAIRATGRLVPAPPGDLGQFPLPSRARASTSFVAPGALWVWASSAGPLHYVIHRCRAVLLTASSSIQRQVVQRSRAHGAFGVCVLKGQAGPFCWPPRGVRHALQSAAAPQAADIPSAPCAACRDGVKDAWRSTGVTCARVALT